MRRNCEMDKTQYSGRDLSDDLTPEELAAYHEEQDRKSAELLASMSPEEKAMAERLGSLFEKVAFSKCR